MAQEFKSYFRTDGENEGSKCHFSAHVNDIA